MYSLFRYSQSWSCLTLVLWMWDCWRFVSPVKTKAKKELRILSFFCLVWWSSLSALGSYIPWSSLYCWCTWCTSDHLLCSSSAGFWLLYPVPVYLDNVLIFIPVCVSLLPSPVCFVFVFEFCQLLLVQPFRSSTMFTHSHGVWHVQFLRLKEDIPDN